MLKFELSEQMVQVIGQLLDNAPHKIARPIIDELQRQVNEQQAPPPNSAAVRLNGPKSRRPKLVSPELVATN